MGHDLDHGYLSPSVILIRHLSLPGDRPRHWRLVAHFTSRTGNIGIASASKQLSSVTTPLSSRSSGVDFRPGLHLIVGFPNTGSTRSFIKGLGK